MVTIIDKKRGAFSNQAVKKARPLCDTITVVQAGSGDCLRGSGVKKISLLSQKHQNML
jgi:hypothetical protein